MCSSDLGAESLGQKVAMVARRQGCCSDYAAAFQLYAGALGLPARRVETQAHTTNEYFDRLTGNWVWVDSMYRTQATDEKGQLLSHYQVRQHLLEHQSIRIIELSEAPIAGAGALAAIPTTCQSEPTPPNEPVAVI